MSSTPEINRSVKFSPYGKPINKSLLTPCRTLGLSRKRKTPCNKTPLNTNVIQSKECGSGAVTPLSNSTLVTPLNHNTPITPLNSNTPVTKTESRETSGKQVIRRPKRGVIGKDRAVKKCLDQNFQYTLQENVPIKEQMSKENASLPLLDEPKKKNNSVKIKKSLINVKVSLERLSEEDIDSYSNTLEENNISSDEESEEIIKVRKRQAIISSDEEEETFHASDGDENFQGFMSKNNMGELKNENLTEINFEKESIFKKNTESNYDERLSDMSQNESVELHIKDTKVQVMPSKKILPLNDSKKNNNIEADTVVLSGSSTKSENSKKTSIVSDDDDDDDFVNMKENKKKLTLTRRESSNTNQRSKEDKKSKVNDKKTKRTNSNENNSNTFQQTKSLTSIIDNEEDAFTSTPEREKNEKIILVQKVKDLENEIKVKRKKVEDLKQAQIYKTKHNIDELKSLTDIWRGGCVKGLNELLNKLQMHGPINMLTLVNNLKIPSDIVEKCLKMNFIDKKNLELKNDSDFDASPK